MVNKQECCGYEIGLPRASHFTPQDIKMKEMDEKEDKVADRTLEEVKEGQKEATEIIKKIEKEDDQPKTDTKSD